MPRYLAAMVLALAAFGSSVCLSTDCNQINGAASSDEDWNWVFEHYHACRSKLLGDPATWRKQSMRPVGDCMVVLNVNGDHLLDVHLVAYLEKGRLTSAKLLLADGFSIYDQMLSVHRHRRDLSDVGVCDCVRLSEVRLGAEDLQRLAALFDHFRDIRLSPHPESVVITDGYDYEIYVASRMNEYVFHLVDGDAFEDSTALKNELAEWCRELVRTLDRAKPLRYASRIPASLDSHGDR